MPRSLPDSIIGSPDTYHSFIDDTAETARSVPAIITNNALPRLGTSVTSPATPTRGRFPDPVTPARTGYHRSVSSPHIHLTRNHGSTRDSPSRPREWTLFGQLMEDEGQLRPINNPKIRRRNGAIGTPSSATSHDPFLVSSVPSSSVFPVPIEPDSLRSDSLDSCDYSSDDSDDSAPIPQGSQPRFPHRWTWLQIPTLSRLQKNVLKCGLAYLFSSLFTFVPYLSSFLADVPSNGKWERGPSPSGHMVATVYV